MAIRQGRAVQHLSPRHSRPYQLSGGELAARIGAAHWTMSRCYEDLLGSVAEIDARDVAARAGYRDTAAYLSALLTVSGRQAAALVSHARAASGSVIDACAAGAVGRHAGS